MTKGKNGQKKSVTGCAGCLGVIFLCFIVGWIANMAGCNKPTQTVVGPSGASVSFMNAVGQATGENATLAPGTMLKWDHAINDTYAVYQVMSGPYNDRWARIDRDNVTER